MSPLRSAQPRQGAQTGGQERLNAALEGLKNLDFSRFRGELATLAQGLTDELFAPGGQVDVASRAALGGTVASGFGPSSGSYDRARHNILGEARNVVGRNIAQGALQLVPFALQQQESLFGGAATVEQLRLAEDQIKQNQALIDRQIQQSGCGIGKRLGNVARTAGTGAIAGSSLPGIGTVTGLIGGGIVGLFGGC